MKSSKLLLFRVPKITGLIFLVSSMAACSKMSEAWSERSFVFERVKQAFETSKVVVSKKSPVQKILKPIPGLHAPKNVEEAKSAVERVNATYYFLVGAHLAERGQPGEALVAFDQLQKIDSGSSRVYLNLAKELLKKGLMTEGVAAARKALEIEPNDRDTKLFLANLFATAKKYGEAVQLFEEVAKESPDHEDVMLYLALIETETKQTNKALQRIQAFLKNNPESALAHYYLGRLLQESGRLKAAELSYQKAIEIRPGFVQAGTFLAFLQEESGNRTGAIETYSWLSVQTDDATFHKKLGHLLLDANQYEGAMKAFQNYERTDPTDLNNKLKIALVQIELKDYVAAQNKLKEILKIEPESDNIRYYLAAVYEQKGEAQKALAEYGLIGPSSKLYFEASKRQIYSLAREKNFAAGKKLLDKMQKNYGVIDSKLPNPNKNKEAGTASLPEGQSLEDVYEVGINFYEAFLPEKSQDLREYIDDSLAHFPYSLKLLYLKGSFLERMGKTNESLEVMLEILKRDPNHASALNFVGYSWAESGKNLDQAEIYIKRALLHKPKDPFVTDSLAWVYYKKGEYRKALVLLEEAYAMRPDEAVIADHLGDVLVKLGRLEEARKYYEIALKLGPTKEVDREKLEQKLARLQGVIQSGCHGDDGRCARLVLDERRVPASDSTK
jgi:tetratricopeptide (TPR) repeat protein